MTGEIDISGTRVLLIDDHTGARDAMRMTLEGEPLSCSVVAPNFAFRGRRIAVKPDIETPEGLQTFIDMQRGRIDIAMIDYCLGHQHQTFDRLRKEGIFRSIDIDNIPIIITTVDTHMAKLALLRPKNTLERALPDGIHIHNKWDGGSVLKYTIAAALRRQTAPQIAAAYSQPSPAPLPPN